MGEPRVRAGIAGIFSTIAAHRRAARSGQCSAYPTPNRRDAQLCLIATNDRTQRPALPRGPSSSCGSTATRPWSASIPAGHAARGTSPRTRRPEPSGGTRARRNPRSCAARRSRHVVALTDTEFFDLSGCAIIVRFAPTLRAFAAYPPSLRSVRYSTIPTLRHSRSQSISSAGRQRKTVDRERNEDDERSRERRAGRRVRSARRPNGPPAMRRVPVTMASIDTITTRIDREDDSRSYARLENRTADLDRYARSGYTLSSTVTVASGECTIIIDTLTKTD